MTFTHKVRKAFQTQTYFSKGKPGAGGGGPVARYRAWRERREHRRIRERQGFRSPSKTSSRNVPPG